MSLFEDRMWVRARYSHDDELVHFNVRLPYKDDKTTRLKFGILTFINKKENAAAPPAFTLPMEDAQVLMDDLWKAGLRPTEGKGSAGQLVATEKHLEDMRAIAASKLKVDFPKE